MFHVEHSACRRSRVPGGKGENAVIAAGKRHWTRPPKAGPGGCEKAGQLRSSGHGCQPATGTNQRYSSLKRSTHPVDGAQRHAVKLALQGFGSAGVDFDSDFKDASGFLEEGGFFALRLGQRHGDLGAADGDGDAGEACAGAEIEQGGNPGGQGAGAGNGFDKMAGKDAVLVANSSKIHARIPAVEQGEVGFKALRLPRMQRGLADGGEKAVEALACGSHVHGCGGHAPATDSSMRRGCQDWAAWIKAAKRARENALVV